MVNRTRYRQYRQLFNGDFTDGYDKKDTKQERRQPLQEEPEINYLDVIKGLQSQIYRLRMQLEAKG